MVEENHISPATIFYLLKFKQVQVSLLAQYESSKLSPRLAG